MNRKERLAAAILVLTLGAGVLVEVFDHEESEDGNDAAPRESSLAGVCGGPAGGGTGENEHRPLEADTSRADSVGCGSDGRTGERRVGVDGYRRININSAGVEELMLLPGVGPKRAQAVLEWRAKNGPFLSVDDLTEVRGIGKSTLERLRPYASAGD